MSKKISLAKFSDISWMVDLSEIKRSNYQKYQPNFFKKNPNSLLIQSKYFEELLSDKNIIALVLSDKSGFIMGRIITPPSVYDAGLTLMIDDFCVSDINHNNSNPWFDQGQILLDEIIKIAKSREVKQILVVSGNHDKNKTEFLKKNNLTIASLWLTKVI
ncbi:MAG: hypothetical protein RL769_211 [Pseudomonadota bacterium]